MMWFWLQRIGPMSMARTLFSPVCGPYAYQGETIVTITPPEKDGLGDWNQRVYADQWAPDTRLDFANVNWDSEYRNIVNFDAQHDLDRYITEHTISHMRLEKMTFVRPYEPVRVNIPFNVATQANYVRVNNPQQPGYYDISGDADSTQPTWYTDVQKNFYYFILDARYVAPNTTQLLLQLDVWQTYGYEVQPGQCYLERGHVGIANSHRMLNYGRDYLTVPEGLDTGNEYNIVYTNRTKIADTNDLGVMVWSTVDLIRSGGTVDNPTLYTATGSTLGDLPNGASVYYFNSVTGFNEWLEEHQEQSWVTQGIIMVMAIPPLTRYGWGDDLGESMDRPAGKTPGKEVEAAPNWRDQIRQRLPKQYRHLDKFLTYPYCVVELTTNTGTPLVLKPEQWFGADAVVQELPHFALPSPRLMVAPMNYNTGLGVNRPGRSTIANHDGGEFLDLSTGFFDFPTFSVVNNSYMGFLASQRNQIQYQHDTADWSQSKALRAADTSYDQADMGIDASNQQTANQIQTGAQMVNMQNQHGTGRAITNAGTSLGMGLMGGPLGLIGGVTSAVSAGANEAINQSERSASQAISAGSMRRSSAIQEEHMAGVRDSNRSLARFAAKGDYANQIAGINARVQDAKMTQPTTSGQVGGEAFNLAVDQWGYDFKVKFIPAGAMRVIGDFWLRFGYAVNAFMVPEQLNVMSHFSYWKFQQFEIIGATIPEHYRNSIRGIFEKGVTVWRRPEDVGRIHPRNNTPIDGEYYV